MEEITLTGGKLLASSDAPAHLSGSGTTKIRNSPSKRGGGGGGAGSTAGGLGSSGGHHTHTHGNSNDNDHDNDHVHGPNCQHHHHQHGQQPMSSSMHKTASELELAMPSPSLEELVHAPKEEILRALSTLFRFGRFEALEPLLQKLQEAQESVSVVFELLKELDEGGHSLLHWAAKRVDDIRFLQLVIDIIAVQFHDKEFLNIASTDNVGMRPLHWACTEGSIPHVALLLTHGADREAKDNSGCTPLLIAAQYGQVETVAYLLQKGANGQAVDSAWDTALHWAAYKGSIQVCGLLSFYQELDWTTVDAYGQTPLHLASLRGHTSVVRYILSHLKKKNQSARDLLFLKDKNQRTPLDLAIHKNRPTVEVVLREAMASEKDPRGHFLRKTLWSNLRDCCSLKTWKSWMGLTIGGGSGSDEVDEPMKGPYYFMFLNFFFNIVLFFGHFCPVTNVAEGLLWDKTGWLLWNVICMAMCWYLFYKTVTTPPGYMDDSMKNIAYWRKLYEETLEAYGDEDPAVQKVASQTPLCHTCHVAKPLRSKHCRISRKCVLVFDHYCPFVNNSVGLYNYRYFYFFLTFMSLALGSFSITLFMYLRRYTKAGHSMPWMTLLMGLEVALTGLPIFGMWVYHTQLTMVNLTTNEHLNVRKYKYLYKIQNGKKVYKNPWFKGWWGNAMDRFNPSERCYMIPKDQQELLSLKQNPGDEIV